MPAPPGARALEDRGSAGLLTVVATLVLSAVLLAGLGRVGQVVVLRARADAGADLVALAGVVGGRSAAEEVARRNQVALVAYRTEGHVVTVSVEAAGVRGTARAGPALPPPRGPAP